MLGVVAAHRRAVAPAVRPADQALVDAGNSNGLVAELLLVDRAGGEVERPAPQQGRGVVGAEALGVEHPVVAHDVEHDAVAVVVGVERVEHVARRHLEPAHVGAVAAERDQPDPGGAVVLPRVREAGAAHGDVEVEDHRQVVDDHPALGDRAVVHHRPVGDVDRATPAPRAPSAPMTMYCRWGSAQW